MKVLDDTGLKALLTTLKSKFALANHIHTDYANSTHSHNVTSTTAAGFAPQRTGTTTKFLRDDGTWAVPPDTKVTVDSELNAESNNPVRNSVVTADLNKKINVCYGTCTTATDTAAKVVTCPEFKLVKGAMIFVNFVYMNGADEITLNVNGTGAKKVYDMLEDKNDGQYVISSEYLSDRGNLFIYDGDSYQLISIKYESASASTSGLLTSFDYGKLTLLSKEDDTTLSIANFSINNSAHVGNHATATGTSTFANGYYVTASGANSHAEGERALAGGSCSHAEGRETTATGESSHAEGKSTEAIGSYCHAEGQNNTVDGSYSHIEGGSNSIVSGSWFTHCEGEGNIANNGQHVEGQYAANATGSTGSGTTGSVLVVGNGTSTTARSNAFRVSKDGKCYGKSAFQASGADYAEYFEWLDGNTDNEDRRGLFVTLEGDKIRIAEPEDDYILGVISATPLIVGDIQSETWKGMYMTDIYGQTITETVEVEEYTDESGCVFPAHTEVRYIVNPDYNPEEKYISREDRPEWGAVGMFGKLVVRDDGTCEVNGYCKVAEGGIATAAVTTCNGYRVLARLDDTHIKVLIK